MSLKQITYKINQNGKDIRRRAILRQLDKYLEVTDKQKEHLLSNYLWCYGRKAVSFDHIRKIVYVIAEDDKDFW